MSVPLDLVGQKFGKLTVIEYAGIKKDNSGHTFSWFKCQCDCGNTCEKKGTILHSDKVNSCGCLYKELAKKKPNYHGKKNLKLYQVWCSFRRRCNSPTDAAYKNYGGRGIGYAPEWDDYLTFEKWALANGYQQDVGLTLERIDVNKGYTPENCCWDTRKRQSNNKRNNLYFTIDGKTHTLAEWCDIYNVPYGRVDVRVQKLGWDIVKALTTPALGEDNTLTLNGRTLTVTEWSKELGIKKSTIQGRIRKGLSVEKILTPVSKYSGKLYQYKGESKTLREWSEITGIKYETLKSRKEKGWSIDQMIETKVMIKGGDSEWRKTHRLRNRTQH